MTGNRRLYMVPVTLLPRQDLADDPNGYKNEDAQRWMASVPQIERLKAAGWTSAEFDRLRTSSNPVERELGATEYYLYRSDTSALKASYDGRQLEVEGGRHRVEAARQRGVESVPVRVWATPENHERIVREFASRQRDQPGRQSGERERFRG